MTHHIVYITGTFLKTELKKLTNLTHKEILHLTVVTDGFYYSAKRGLIPHKPEYFFIRGMDASDPMREIVLDQVKVTAVFVASKDTASLLTLTFAGGGFGDVVLNQKYPDAKGTRWTNKPKLMGIKPDHFFIKSISVEEEIYDLTFKLLVERTYHLRVKNAMLADIYEKAKPGMISEEQHLRVQSFLANEDTRVANDEIECALELRKILKQVSGDLPRHSHPLFL